MADNSSILAALKGVDPADAMPFGAGATPEGSPNMLSSMLGGIMDIPKHLLQNSQHSLDTGTYDPTVPMEAAATLAGAGAPAAEAGAAGIFGGKLAKTADIKALDEAQKMRNGGIAPGQVWQDTGWYRNPADRQWRFEIPDNNMKFNATPVGAGDSVSSIYAHHLVNHPKLFEAYPDLKNIHTTLTDDKRVPTGTGWYNNNGVGRSIEVNAPNTGAAKSVMAHELQHGVQDIEGFSWGADPSHYAGLIESGLKKNPDLLSGNSFMDVVNQANKLYHGTAGEVEARNVMTRLPLTSEQRRLQTPWSTQDVSFANQYDHDPVSGMVRALVNRGGQ